jgi:hypothetical protein
VGFSAWRCGGDGTSHKATVPAAARGGSARTGGQRGASAVSPPDRCTVHRADVDCGTAQRRAQLRTQPLAFVGKRSVNLNQAGLRGTAWRPRLELLLHNLALLVDLCAELVHCLRRLIRHNRSAQRATWRAPATARAAVEFAQRAWLASASSMASSEVASTRFASSAKCSGYRAICCTTDAVVSHRLLRTKAAGRGAHVRMTRDA